MKVKHVWAKGLLATVALVVCGGLIGCDWTTNTDSFNTSSEASQINFSGVYHGNLSGGRAVQFTSGGPIIRLVINQGGNTVTVTDNNGSKYRGTISGVSLVNVVSGGDISAGGQFARGQISFRGHDNIAAREIEFTGTIHVVAVQDIKGNTSTSSSSSSTTNGVDTTTSPTTTSEYALGEQNTQYRLEGTWIENPGKVSAVDAIAAGSAGVISVSDNS